MKIGRNLFSTLTMVAGTLSIITFLLTVFKKISIPFEGFEIVIASLFGAIVSFYLANFVRVLNKNPEPLKVGIIGQQNAGKTVYLTILFRELSSYISHNISFQPYGTETIDNVTKNLNMLTTGKWLPKTTKGPVDPFLANLKIGQSMFSKKYTLEINDYAGEHTEELDNTNEKYQYKTDYLKYLVQADGLFIAVDGQKICEKKESQIYEMIHVLVANLQVTFNEKGVFAGETSKIPIAILILKSDLLSYHSITRDEVFTNIKHLWNVCSKLSKKVEVFFVSAVGEIQKDGSPPTTLKPKEVVYPAVWLTSNIKS